MRRTAVHGRLLPLLVAVLVLAACGSPAPPGGTGSPAPSGSTPSEVAPSGSPGPPSGAGSAPSEVAPSGSPGPPSGAGSAPEGEVARPPAVPQPVWDAVLADLTTRTGGPPQSVTVVRAEAVTWNDGSLGCPEPGMVYTQALVDGYHVVLDVSGEQYDYRVGSGAAVRLCTSAQTP
ncbi:hypothetical protein ATJ97_2718 [Georgenia soli]|uniref:LppP/LprE lipoprotein n=1 Tax=Georgenia soli TaxID=638953 RepID=A0A2A9EM78_9MICO|nr:hypothetical protein [Georgenia soli]PFG40197.1 hypothetical protein ATJ97_2718 [Georgenia soli]